MHSPSRNLNLGFYDPKNPPYDSDDFEDDNLGIDYLEDADKRYLLTHPRQLEPRTVTNSSVRTYYDDSIVLTKEKLEQKKEENDAYYSKWRLHNKTTVDQRLKQQYIDQIRSLMKESQTYYLLTYTFCEGHTFDLKEAKEKCYSIRSKHIKFFHQNHKCRRGCVTRPSWFPRQFFFIEPKNDRYHVHVLMEGIPKKIFLQKYGQNKRFRTIFERLTQDKLYPRNQEIITQKMIDRFERYVEHQHYGRTYNTLDVWDDWLVSRLLVEYIMHRTKDEKWGVNGVHQSPICNHAKVMNESEALSKVEYLNKDEFFKINSDIQGENFCYEYSDIT